MKRKIKPFVDNSVTTVDNRRGVYSGPQRLLPDPDKIDLIPQNFYLTDDERLVFHNIVQNGYQLSCDTICHPLFWQDEWVRCPLCGGGVMDDHWVHEAEQ